MADRTAIDTIRGYFYQFDYSIISILKLKYETDSIVVEGIEDIDITTATETTAIQCKYYEKTEYNHSVIKEPIQLMLNHFNEVKLGNQNKIKYKLRGHYKSGHSKLQLPLNIQQLKDNFLTSTKTKTVDSVKTKIKYYHHITLKLTDVELREFIGLLEIDINATEFEQQFKEIIDLLKSEFKCSDFSSEFYFYNSALRVIRDISKSSILADRKISKSDFLKRVNNSRILFNEWFLQLRGEKAHYTSLRREYFSNINILFKERFFLIEIDPNSYSRSDLKTVLSLIIKNYTKIINQPNPFCPYIYLHGIENFELIEIKNDFTDDDIIILDGFDFEGANFNPKSLFRKPTLSHQIKLKFVNKLETLNEVLNLTGRRSEIYQFYLNDTYFDYRSDSIKQIKIQVNNLNKLTYIL